MNYGDKLPVSDIKLVNNNDFKHKLNRKIIQDLENHNKVANTVKYGLKISEHLPSKVLIMVYKDIYRLKEGFFNKAILFKEYFNEFENKSKVGKIKYEWHTEEEDKAEEFNVYNGNFSAYVLILQKLYFFYFIEEINRKDKYFVSILDFINIKHKEVSTNPFNYFLMECMSKLVLESEFTSIDIKEYVELTLDLIYKEMDKSKGNISKGLKKDEKSIFLNDEYEEFFLFILNENENKKNGSFFSTLHRYLIKEAFLAQDKIKPNFYFKYLKEKNIFQFKQPKLISPSTSSEENHFIEFDKLYSKFILLKE
ncbi:hypothetical protein [Lutibacter sp.]|uniref:hypothetical protein n=1 Tax=Lutibacter sp. TaxID=1925666 RepID=UPI0035627692